eukprot:488617_1
MANEANKRVFVYKVMDNQSKKQQLMEKIRGNEQIRAYNAYKKINREFSIQFVRNRIALGYYGLRHQEYDKQNNMSPKHVIKLLGDIFHMTPKQIQYQIEMWDAEEKDKKKLQPQQRNYNKFSGSDCKMVILENKTNLILNRQQMNRERTRNQKQEMDWSGNDGE